MFFLRISLFVFFAPFQLVAQQSTTPFSFRTAASFHTDTLHVNSLTDAANKVMPTNLDSSLHLALRAADLSKQVGFNSGFARCLYTLASIYQNKGAYTSAVTYAIDALKMYEQLGDIASQASTYVLLAYLYKDMSGTERIFEYSNISIGYSNRAISLYKSITDTAGIVNSLSLLGTTYRDKAIAEKRNSFYDTAFGALSKAIQLQRLSGKGEKYISKLYNNISQVYIEQKHDYHTALMYLFQAIAINERNNNVVSLSFNYGNVSSCYLGLGKKELTLLYAKKSVTASEKTGRPNRLVNAYRQLNNAYYHFGMVDSAFKYYQMSSTLEDSLNSVAITSKVDELQTRYETGKKEAAINLLHAENEIKNARIFWLVTGLIIIGILAIALIALYRRVQLQKVQLAAQANRLEVMMKELHHRVKNNLQIVSSLLNMQTYKVQDEESIHALKTSGERVQAMSLIHQRLYKKDELTAVNLKEYITDLAESLMQSYGYSHDSFELQIDVQQELMDVDTALPIGLIVNELITNSLKYAYAHVERPSLLVSLLSVDGGVRLSVKDNGHEFNLSKWQQGKGSFGKQLIVSLCRQLRAKQSIDISNGTEFVINIPLKAA